jgi:hypothetical protein
MLSKVTDDNCSIGKEVGNESRILSNGQTESALSMKFGFSSMTLRESGRACNGNLQAYITSKKWRQC